MKELQRIYDEGGSWVVCGGAQHGKSTANRAFAESHQRYKDPTSGNTIVEVATTTACPGENLFYADLAESFGVVRLMRRQNATEVLAAAILRSRTRMIIVNNGHEMDPKQWSRWLALQEVYFRRGGAAPALVLSSIGPNVGMATVSPTDEAMQQLRKRLFYSEVSGHDRDEVRRALRLFLERGDPATLRTDVLEHYGALYEALTDPFFDPLKTRRVAAIDIDEVARRIEALAAAGERSGERLVEQAVADYRRSRTFEAA